MVEALGAQHDRAAFSCGNASLDDFLKTRARKENELGYSAVFIMVAAGTPDSVVGYYTLSAHSMRLDGIGLSIRRKLPRYPVVPTTLIGRLARDVSVRKCGVGELLLLDALRRALGVSDQVGSYAVTVDAIDDAAVAFYLRYGFTPLEGDSGRLYLPMESVRKLQWPGQARP